MLLLTASLSGLFKWRQFDPEVILLALGWYLRSLSRTVRSRSCSPSVVCMPTASRCGDLVQRYAPKLLGCLRRHLKPTNDSWRMDSDVRPGERQVALPVSGGGFHRRDPRFPSLGQAGRGRGQALSRQSAWRSEPSRAAGDQHRRPRRVSAHHRAAQSRRRSGRGLPALACAIFE